MKYNPNLYSNNDLIFDVKMLENEMEIKPKISTRKDIILNEKKIYEKNQIIIINKFKVDF